MPKPCAILVLMRLDFLSADHVAVVFDQRIHLALPRQRLNYRNVDFSGWLRLAATDRADHALANAQERLQALLPLLEQFGSMHQHQRVDATASNHLSSSHRFAKGRRRVQDAGVRLPKITIAEEVGFSWTV